MLLDFTNIAQPNIPISTAAHTHNVRFVTHTLSYTFFKKSFFKHILGPFPGPQELLPTIFEFRYSRYVPSNFSRRFDLFYCFLLHGTSFHLLLGLVNIFFSSKVHGGMNPALYY